MFEKFFTKIYTFVLALIFVVLVIYFSFMIDTKTELSAMTFQLLLATLLIVIFFNLLRVFLSRDRGSYRSMILEKPLFNPKGKADNLALNYPLFPKFIALYFDRTGDDPYKDELISIQAVRYENGYLTDGLFLPVKRSKERKKRKLLYFEDAYRYLKTYTKDFPIIVDNKDFANTYLREHLNSMMFKDSTDIVGISKMIYPNLEENGIEDINDFLKLEIDVEDNLYGAKIVAAVYLDYLRLNKYYTETTLNPFAKSNDLIPVYPEGYDQKMVDKNIGNTTSTWEENEKDYKSQAPIKEDSFKNKNINKTKVKKVSNTKKKNSALDSIFSKFKGKNNNDEKVALNSKEDKNNKADNKTTTLNSTSFDDESTKVIDTKSDDEFQKLLDIEVNNSKNSNIYNYEYNPNKVPNQNKETNSTPID